MRCDCDLRFPVDTGTPGWHHSSQGSRPPSWLHRHRSGCGHLDGHRDVDWLVSTAKQWPRTQKQTCYCKGLQETTEKLLKNMVLKSCKSWWTCNTILQTAEGTILLLCQCIKMSHPPVMFAGSCLEFSRKSVPHDSEAAPPLISPKDHCVCFLRGLLLSVACKLTFDFMEDTGGFSMERNSHTCGNVPAFSGNWRLCGCVKSHLRTGLFSGTAEKRKWKLDY